MSETMQAAWYDKIGQAAQVLQTGTTEKPFPLRNEVLVRIHVSGVNPSDAKKRSGTRGQMQFPRIIPHSDGAGIIEAVGEDVSHDRIDERVWVWNAQWNRPFGTAAEYVALPEEQAAPLPENVSFEAGACLGIPAMTAYVALDINQKFPSLSFLEGLKDQAILVTGANGAVAHYAIGFAKNAGAKVIATAGTPETARGAQQMGVDVLTEHADVNPERFRQDVAGFTGGEGVARIITSELGTLLDVAPEILKPDGVVAAYGSEIAPVPVVPFYPLMFKNASLEFIFVYQIADPMRKNAIQGINQLLGQGKISAAIDQVFPLEEISQAHERVESGEKCGMVLVTMP